MGSQSRCLYSHAASRDSRGESIFLTLPASGGSLHYWVFTMNSWLHLIDSLFYPCCHYHMAFFFFCPLPLKKTLVIAFRVRLDNPGWSLYLKNFNLITSVPFTVPDHSQVPGFRTWIFRGPLFSLPQQTYWALLSSTLFYCHFSCFLLPCCFSAAKRSGQRE